MKPKDEAYRIIRTEAMMIDEGDRSVAITIRWLKDAIDLLEEEVRRG